MSHWEELLSKVDVFFGLSTHEREALLGNAREIELKRKDTLYTSSTPATHLYVIDRGSIKTVNESDRDRRLLADFLGPGDVFGEEGLLLGGEYETDALPFDETAVLALPLPEIRRAMEQNARMSRAMAGLAAGRARAYRERLFEMAVEPVPARLGLALHMLARRFGRREKKGTVIALRVTHQDLADYIGASRETVSLFLARFRSEGLITMNVRRIVVPDMKRLKRASRDRHA